jgi:hypothetical protein
MSGNFKFNCCVFFLLLTFNGIAQEIKNQRIDSLYREDQFYIGVTYNLLSAVPDGVSIRGLSGGIQFGYLRDMPVNERRNVAIAVGAGMVFDRFGQTLFIGESGNEQSIFTVIDDDIEYDTNRLSMSAVEVPLEFRWRTSSPKVYKFWRIHAGVRLGYVYWYKSTFRQPDNEVIQTAIPEFDRLRMGATFSFGYNTFNFYGYYGINPFFKDAVTTGGEAVDFKTIKIGLIFYIL